MAESEICGISRQFVPVAVALHPSVSVPYGAVILAHRDRNGTENGDDMTSTETLIDERLNDLREDSPGSVRATVDHLLAAAWDAIWERKEQDADGITTALGHVDAALAVFTAYRARPAAMGEGTATSTWRRGRSRRRRERPRWHKRRPVRRCGGPGAR